MYSLIADSGSTKTDWRLINGTDTVLSVRTIGFNPYFQTRDQINLEILNQLKPHLSEYIHEISSISYYGTGCSTAENCTMIQDCLTLTLDVEKVDVSHDLLAAARALCGHETGIAAILGTGSNSGLYDGKNIIENVPSTGYLWSDYGGGSQIGKHLIREYFEERMPEELCEKFEAAGYNRETILNNVYKTNMPARYLAGATVFVKENHHHPFISMLLESCFDSFFIYQVNKYTNSKKFKVHTVGSVGFHFKDTFTKVARKHGYQVGNVIQSPMEGLVKFHSQQS